MDFTDTPAHQNHSLVKTEAELNEQIAQIRKRINVFFKWISGFDLKTCNSLGLTSEQLPELVSVFTSITDEEAWEILHEAHRRGAITSVFHISLAELVKFCEWLNGKKGKDLMESMARLEDLKRNIPPGVDAKAYVLAKVLPELKNDYDAATKKVQTLYDQKIEDLQHQISKMKRKRDEEINAISAAHYPANIYKPLSEGKVFALSFEMYHEDAKKNGTMPVLEEVAAMELAVERYGDVVRQNHIIEFLQNKTFKHEFDHLLKYLEKKILHFDGEGNESQASTFRMYMKAAGGEPPAKAPLRIVAKEDEINLRKTARTLKRACPTLTPK